MTVLARLVALFALIFTVAAHGQTNLDLIFSDDPAQRDIAYAAMVRDPARAAPPHLLIAANHGADKGDMANAAYLFYLGQMRNNYDRMRFDTRGMGGNDPQLAMRGLMNQIGTRINPWAFADLDGRLSPILDRLALYAQNDLPNWPVDHFTQIGLKNGHQGQNETDLYRQAARDWVAEGRKAKEEAKAARR